MCWTTIEVSGLSVFLQLTKVSSFDQPLMSVWTAHSAPLLLSLFDPVIELASSEPHG
jgi:hypothetical protein